MSDKPGLIPLNIENLIIGEVYEVSLDGKEWIPATINSRDNIEKIKRTPQIHRRSIQVPIESLQDGDVIEVQYGIAGKDPSPSRIYRNIVRAPGINPQGYPQDKWWSQNELILIDVSKFPGDTRNIYAWRLVKRVELDKEAIVEDTPSPNPNRRFHRLVVCEEE